MIGSTSIKIDMNMNRMPITLCHSSIEAEKVYTSYKWSLKDWSLLYDHYKGGVKSDEFALTKMEGSKCVLNLKYIARKQYQGHSDGIDNFVLQIQFLNNLEFHTMQASLSLVNDKMKKLNTSDTVYNKSFLACVDMIIPHSDLTRTSQYLQKDTLILFVELTIVKGVKTSATNTEAWNANFSTDVGGQLNKIFNSKDLCDITFVVGGKQLPAHKVIVAANSEVFRTIFTTEMKRQATGRIEITNTDATVFEALLRYMYTGQVDKLENVVNDLIVVADTYKVMGLKKMCECFMSNHLNNETAISYLLSAQELLCTELQGKAVDYIRANIHVLGNTDHLARLMDHPDLIAEVFGKCFGA